MSRYHLIISSRTTACTEDQTSSLVNHSDLDGVYLRAYESYQHAAEEGSHHHQGVSRRNCGLRHPHMRRSLRCRVVTRVRVEGRDHGGLGLRSRGEGIRHGMEA